MIIRHVCVDCGHPDFWAPGQQTTAIGFERDGVSVTVKTLDDRGQASARVNCGQGCHGRKACKWGEPAVGRRWDLSGQPVELLLAPGGAWGPPMMPAKSCDCDACKAVYELAVA